MFPGPVVVAVVAVDGGRRSTALVQLEMPFIDCTRTVAHAHTHSRTRTLVHAPSIALLFQSPLILIGVMQC